MSRLANATSSLELTVEVASPEALADFEKANRARAQMKVDEALRLKAGANWAVSHKRGAHSPAAVAAAAAAAAAAVSPSPAGAAPPAAQPTSPSSSPPPSSPLDEMRWRVISGNVSYDKVSVGKDGVQLPQPGAAPPAAKRASLKSRMSFRRGKARDPKLAT